MGRLAIRAGAITTQPQVVLRVALSIILWSLAMPLIGFVIFAAMTLLPLLFLLMPASTFFGTLYMTGFVPSVLTALFFQAIVHRTKPLVAVLATGLVSMLSATLWWATMLLESPATTIDPSQYTYWALMAAAFGSALVMAVSGLRARRRRR